MPSTKIEVHMTKSQQELFYRRHRDRVAHAKAIVDCSAPILSIGNFLNDSKLSQDVRAYISLNQRNADLMKCINGISRTAGTMNTFKLSKDTTLIRSKVPILNEAARKIEKENLYIGQRILAAKSMLKTRKNEQRHQESETIDLPTKILEKYGDLFELPDTGKMLRRLLRPRIYFDLEVMNVRPLGRIIMQLYTEACPDVVLEFMRMCTQQEKDRIELIRIFPGLWVEGEIKLDSKELQYPKIEYDMRAINHGINSGILSFSRSATSFIHGILNFTISFKPLSVLNGERVAFGMVLYGHNLLNCMQEYGTKNGKPIKQIGITSLGVIT